MYDLLLKGGEVIDPAQGLHGKMDIAIKDGKIAALAKEINDAHGVRVVSAAGKLVTPGLVDLHCHAAEGLLPFGVNPNEVGAHVGVTLICDGGSAGAGNFAFMRREIIEQSQTRMFCFLNLATQGLAKIPEICEQGDMDMERTRKVIEENLDVIKGVKLRATRSLAAGIGITAVEAALGLARDFHLPFVFHVGDSHRVPGDIIDDFSRAAVRLMDKDDILCHIMTWEAGGLIQPDGTVQPELWEAQKRQVVLDACHGLSHFSLTVARLAIEQGILPTVISTDLIKPSQPSVQSLLVTMSKFLNMGLTIDQVVEMTTINPAKAIGEESTHGALRVGMPANITLMEIVEGEYTFCDGNGLNRMQGSRLLEPQLVLQEGVERACHSLYHVPPEFTTVKH